MKPDDFVAIRYINAKTTYYVKVNFFDNAGVSCNYYGLSTRTDKLEKWELKKWGNCGLWPYNLIDSISLVKNESLLERLRKL